MKERMELMEIGDTIHMTDSRSGSTQGEQVKTESEGARLIAAERMRQINVEGWTPDHDRGHTTGELAMAAATYALPADRRKYRLSERSPGSWPWEDEDWKPTPNDRVRELIKAGALIAAEIDRLTRFKGKSS